MRGFAASAGSAARRYWPSRRSSIKIRGQVGPLRMFKHAVDLRRRRATDRQRRQCIAVEERRIAGLDAGARAAARDLANEKYFIDGIQVMRPVVFAIVVD